LKVELLVEPKKNAPRHFNPRIIGWSQITNLQFYYSVLEARGCCDQIKAKVVHPGMIGSPAMKSV